MYTILVTDEHELIATQRERIMQRSKLIDKLHFLVPPNYDNLDMSATTVYMEYKTPVGHDYSSELLTMSPELYKGHLEFIVPFDTNLTKEAGDLEVQLSFTCVIMDETGKVSQYVRKTSPTTITIVPIAAWADVIPDSALTPLDQRMIYADKMIQQMADINMALADAVPDDIMVQNGKVYLSQNGQIMPNTIGADVVVPRTKDDDGVEDGFIELDSYVAEPDEEVGNYTEL